MDQRLYQLIKDDFPEMYARYSRLHAPGGWAVLIYELSKVLYQVNQANNEPIPKVDAVKQKYGGLRFVTAGCDNRSERLISDAENESELICETCGEPGRLRNEDNPDKWLYTACDLHHPYPTTLPDDEFEAIIAKQMKAINKIRDQNVSYDKGTADP